MTFGGLRFAPAVANFVGFEWVIDKAGDEVSDKDSDEGGGVIATSAPGEGRASGFALE